MTANDQWVITRVIVPFSTWTIIFQIIPALLAQFVPRDEWFFTLNSSPYKPPPIVIQSVWPFLYFTLSTYGWYISHELKKRRYQTVMVVYIIHMILNWMYAAILFGWYSTIGSMVTTIIQGIIILSLVIFHFVDRKWHLAVLLTPFLMWISYVSYLNSYIAIYN